MRQSCCRGAVGVPRRPFRWQAAVERKQAEGAPAVRHRLHTRHRCQRGEGVGTCLLAVLQQFVDHSLLAAGGGSERE